MSVNPSKSTFTSKNVTDTTPQPGEIWEVSQDVKSPLALSWLEQQKLYSESAQRFLEGKSSPRYVIIITQEPLVDPEEDWQEVSVMLLSSEAHFLSEVDLLIPTKVTAAGQDLLAETWHILPMLTCNLLQPVGRRLSREIYDVLMSVGDYYYGLVNEAPSLETVQGLGLKIGTVSGFPAFHQQEKAWSDVLCVPVAAYRTYLKGFLLTDAILNEALQLERAKSTNPAKKMG